jgi:phospholipase C
VASPSPIDHVVILVQENHTTDNYFRSMAAFGANVATDWPISPNPPASDQPHDRHGYYRWLTKQSTGTHLHGPVRNPLTTRPLGQLHRVILS